MELSGIGVNTINFHRKTNQYMLGTNLGISGSVGKHSTPAPSLLPLFQLIIVSVQSELDQKVSLALKETIWTLMPRPW